jgi:Adenylate kinase
MAAYCLKIYIRATEPPSKMGGEFAETSERRGNAVSQISPDRQGKIREMVSGECRGSRRILGQTRQAHRLVHSLYQGQEHDLCRRRHHQVVRGRGNQRLLYPRTVRQANALEGVLGSQSLTAVVELVVDEGELFARIEARAREAGSAGAGVRADDNSVTLRKRLVAFIKETQPLSAFYEDRSLLFQIDGKASVEEVAATIDDHLADIRMSRSFAMHKGE